MWFEFFFSLFFFFSPFLFFSPLFSSFPPHPKKTTNKTKQVGEKEKAPTNPIGNYAILVNDALVVCMKEQTGLKYIGVYFLSDMEMVVKNEDGLFVTTSGGKLSLSCGAGK